MREDRKQWLAGVVEEPIDPARPLIDAHHHLWDFPGSRYLNADLLADIRGHNVRQSVFVECMACYRDSGPDELRPVGETQYIESLAIANAEDETSSTRIAAAILSHADLQLAAAVEPVLLAHKAASPTRFRGIRHAAAWDASEDVRNSHSNPPQSLYLREDFHAGFELLKKHGLIFEAWCIHPQIKEVASLARAFPGTTIVMDHVGGPVGIGPYANKSDQVFTDWQSSIRELATCQNVVVKLGGLAMPLNGFGWHRRDKPADSLELEAAFGRYFHYCIEQFGVERCMFESNFPVDMASCSYTVLWNTFKRIAGRYNNEDQDALLHDNALRTYQLDRC